MKIQASTVTLASQYSKIQEHHVSERLETWRDPPPQISDQARQLQANDQAAVQGTSKVAALQDEGLSADLALLKSLLEKLTGRTIRLLRFEPASSEPVTVNAPAANGETRDTPEGPKRAGWGLDYQREETYREAESMSFAASGSVQTADGRQIQFSATLSLSREYVSTSSERLQLGDRKDPLVLNYAAPAARLTGEQFGFDIDNNGTQEQLSRLADGSAFLALDQNADGKVNNGGELFGAQTGNGFAELAAYDSDQNGWIDESDAVYGKLSLWLQDETGGRLASLKEMNVGAIFLGSVASPFTLTTDAGVAQGETRATGVYLTESGEAKTVQQLDLFA